MHLHLFRQTDANDLYKIKLRTPTATQLTPKYAMFNFTSCVLVIASLYSPTPGSGIFAFPSQNALTCRLAISNTATFVPATANPVINPILPENNGYIARNVEQRQDRRTWEIDNCQWERGKGKEGRATDKVPLACVVRVLCSCCAAVFEYFTAVLDVDSYFWRWRMAIVER
jgi:hypothetical protein